MLRLSLALSAVLLLALTAFAQEGFRITFDVERPRADQARVTGRVFNEGSGDVFDVSVTVEALDARGKVVARGISYVDARIPRGDNRPFVASVPAGPAATRFRLVVSSFRAGFANQGP
jgi:hypothetical protein